MHEAVMNKVFSLLLVTVAFAGQAVFAEEAGVLDKAGKGIEKGAQAAGKGVEKGVDAAAKGVQKGVDATGKGFKKAGAWVEKKAGKEGDK
jgi:hypothetical protein